MADEVRARFAPSPTGDLHVGNIRTALYNWAFVRHLDGRLIFRLEDTDRSRSSDEACAAAIDTMHWLGLDWDEGVEVGGPDGPYRQSERYGIYREWTDRFLGEGSAYSCYCSQEEVAARSKAAGRPPGYDGHCRSLTEGQIDQYRAEGRLPAIRLRMQAGTTSFDDLVRGEVSFDNATVPDFVLVRADGHPLYTLAVAVDDVLMRITHIVRGEDLLSSTPRQVAVYRAMGIPPERWPRFGHLPMVLGPDGQRLSKRNGVVSIAWYRREGFLPEAMCNYLALLGWSPGDDRELFNLTEMRAGFEVGRVNRNPARFDLKKLEAINAEKIRELPEDELHRRVLMVLSDAGLLTEASTAATSATLKAGVRLIQTRIRRLVDAVPMLAFLLVEEAEFVRDPDDVAAMLIPEAVPALQAALVVLDKVDDWVEPRINAALRAGLDVAELKTKTAFPPLYVAVVGHRTGPPLFDSLALLGRDRVLGRLESALELARGGERAG
ncbi:MAG TPA: glutamate--tRNA ligase [Mycobacteriales bacterium]|nr:glutamate--tRNA ligase [Mycobacteriales bacterium]